MVDGYTPRLPAVYVLTAVSIFLIAANAQAQVQMSSWTPLQEGPAITAVLGRASTELASRDGSFDLATRVDVPVHSRFLVRLEAGKAGWVINQPNPFDRISITRVMVSIVIKERYPRFTHVRLYGGGGLGRYYFDASERSLDAWRGGAHVFAGFEIPFPETRLTLVTEGQLHVTVLPSQFTAPNAPLLGGASVSLGLKIRM